MSISHKAMSICLLSASAIISASGLYASAALAGAAVGPAAARVDAQTQEQTEEKRKTLMADATDAIAETQRALTLLDAGNKSEALAALSRASGKLDIILARDSTLALAPAGISVLTTDFKGGTAAAKKLSQQAKDLLDQGRIQDARLLLRDLASETVVSVANIPLATYPVAIAEAVKAIDANDIQNAKAILLTALNAQVLTETTIPLPVVAARDSLKEAESLSEKKDRSPDDNAHLKASLDQAREQLEFAQALGYGTKKDFDDLYQQLTDAQKKSGENKSGAAWYGKLKESISNLLRSNEHATSNSKP